MSSTKLQDNPAFFVAFAFYCFANAAMFGTSAAVASVDDDIAAMDDKAGKTQYQGGAASAFFAVLAGLVCVIAAIQSMHSTETNRNATWLVSIGLFALAKCADYAQQAQVAKVEDDDGSYDYDDKAADGPMQGFGFAAAAMAVGFAVAIVGAILFGRVSMKVAGSSSTPSVWFAFLGLFSLAYAGNFGGYASASCNLYQNMNDDAADDDTVDRQAAECGGDAWATLALIIASVVAFGCGAVCVCYKEDIARTKKTLWAGWFVWFFFVCAGAGGSFAGSATDACISFTSGDDHIGVGHTMNQYSCQGSTGASVLAFIGALFALVGGFVSACSAPNSAESPSKARLVLFHLTWFCFFAANTSSYSGTAHGICYASENFIIDLSMFSTSCRGYTGGAVLAGLAAFTSFIAVFVASVEQMPVSFSSVSVNGAEK